MGCKCCKPVRERIYTKLTTSDGDEIEPIPSASESAVGTGRGVAIPAEEGSTGVDAAATTGTGQATTAVPVTVFEAPGATPAATPQQEQGTTTHPPWLGMKEPAHLFAEDYGYWEKSAGTKGSLPWWLRSLRAAPGHGKVVVVRKEIREMSKAEQDRFVRAVLKMRENEKDAAGEEIPASSQYFRLACYHGGQGRAWPHYTRGEPEDPYPSYCVHGWEAFPGWHRAYLVEFERTMRRADMANGGDGDIGLPYWDWLQPVVKGETFPHALWHVPAGDTVNTQGLLTDFGPKFFSKEGGRFPKFRVLADEQSKALFDAEVNEALVGQRGSTLVSQLQHQVDRCLEQEDHELHACSNRVNGSGTSLESPHNRIHALFSMSRIPGQSGMDTAEGHSSIMGSYQSAYHPLFWLHHNNIDRIYDKYLELEPNSKLEYEESEQRWAARIAADPNIVAKARLEASAGLPEGPYGPYVPFHLDGRQFHARDLFVETTESNLYGSSSELLGFKFNKLPRDPKLDDQIREAPYVALFSGIDVNKMGQCRNLFVYVTDGDAAWVPPEDSDFRKLMGHPGFAGFAAIFFNSDSCANCESRLPFDEMVDVTAALRKNQINPRDSKGDLRTDVLKVMVHSLDGTLLELQDIPAASRLDTDGDGKVSFEEFEGRPASSLAALQFPVLKGPRFAMTNSTLRATADGDADPDAGMLRALLASARLMPTKEADTATETAAIKKLQQAARLRVTGIADPATKRALLVAGLREDGNGAGLEIRPKYLMSWKVEGYTVPGYLPKDLVDAELEGALTQWSVPTGIAFTHTPYAATADIIFSWSDLSATNNYLFDGPGGALAIVAGKGVTFDTAERWELSGRPHHRRSNPGLTDFDFFKLLPVALHEIGHIFGLKHTDNPADVMAPFYSDKKVQLSRNDVVNVRKSLALAAAAAPNPNNANLMASL